MKSRFEYMEISGLAVAVSNQWTPVEKFIDNPDEENVKKFKKNTGVEGRYDAGEKQTTSDFCYEAAKKVLAHANVKPEDIGLLVFVTQTADYYIPSTACVLQKRLGLSEDVMAFDVNQGCAGLVYGMNIVCSLLQTSNIDKALLLAGDISGKNHRKYIEQGYIPEEDNEAKLFGDAGMAMLLNKTDRHSVMNMMMRTDGSGFQAIIKPWNYNRHPDGVAVTKMDGIEVFNFAIDKPPWLIKELMEENGTVPEDYDCLVLHQANKFIMQQVAKRAGFKSKQNLISIDRFGNTSSASIATALVKYYGEENTGKVLAMLCGFGIGLSWGAVSVEIEKKNILPLIHTDEWFDDGIEEYTGQVR